MHTTPTLKITVGLLSKVPESNSAIRSDILTEIFRHIPQFLHVKLLCDLTRVAPQSLYAHGSILQERPRTAENVSRLKGTELHGRPRSTWEYTPKIGIKYL
jgi:hypothetical protein